jgi:DNA-binding CsgD family transcriptional regulator
MGHRPTRPADAGRGGRGRALLERNAALRTLDAAVRAAAAGRGSAVLVTGEAGIGKTSLVREFVERTGGRVKVLGGSCDNLVTPRPLGPLRDAAAGTGGKLAVALRAGGPDAVYPAIVEELAWPAPNVLLVEDLHWADDATVDVLAYVARRLEGLPTVLVLTYRDDSVPAQHPARRLLGALAGVPVARLPLAPLSAGAVEELTRDTGWDPRVLHELSGGNPFYVTEAVAAPGAEVPATVADAVLARLRRLSARCREAVEQLSVVPTPVDFELAEALLDGRLDALTEAEDTGILRVRAGGLVFRHELARRAVEQSLSGLRRRGLHAAVVRALRAAPEPQLARLVHHATEAGDGATVSRFAPQAGREAVAAGSHRQALAHFAAALRHAHRLEPAELARVVDEHAWELYNGHRYREALAEAERAVELYRRLDDERGLGTALVRLSRHRYMVGDTPGAERAAEEALRVLSAGDRAATDPGVVAYAATYHGAVLALSDRPADGSAVLARALELARRAGRPDLVALSSNYRSIADADLDEEQRLDLLRSSLALALEHGSHEIAARAYNNLTELLYRYHRLDELEQVLAAGQRFVVERGFPSHAYDLAVHRCLLDLRRGRWAAAGDGLRTLVQGDADLGMLAVYSLPPHARLLARRGDPAAGPLLERAWQQATEQRLLHGLAFAGAALLEWAWLNDRPDRAAEVLAAWRPHAGRPGAEQPTAELLRYAARAGLPVEEFPGCPQPWAAGLRGDWAGAARRWAEIGDPYEQALELADSGEVEPTLTALRVLEDLGATAAARLVRRKLRALGITRVPRRSHASTRANPAGLTQRQLDVLDLLADGLTNAEIADRLVVSVRTVDSHVAAVLGKLGVRTRREAARLRRP